MRLGDDGRVWVDISHYGTNLSWAVNFDEHCYQMWEERNQTWNMISVKVHEAKKYNGTYKYRKTFDSIRFENQSDLTMFLLRWA